MIPRTLLALLVTAALAAPAAAQITTYGFDGVSAPGAFQQIFPGLANGPHLVYTGVTLDGGVILNDALFDDAATSGSNILASCDTCGLGDNPPSGLPGVISGVFDSPVHYVALDVSNGTGQAGNFVLELFDDQGQPIGSSGTQLGPMGSAFDSGHLDLALSLGNVKSFTLRPTNLNGYTFAMDTLRFGDQPGGWGSLGTGLVGTQGVPLLTGSGDLVAGSQNNISVRQGVPGGSAFLVVGASQLGLPFKGGVLIPSPDLVLGPLPLNAQGNTLLPFTWPAGLPPALTIFMQAWIPDGAGPVGFSASAALLASTN